jgi:NADH-quinone oxidoreductase subunit L
MHEIIKFIPLVPLIGFLIVGLFGKYIKNEKIIGSIASGAVGISFIFSVMLLLHLINHPIEKPIIVPVYEWIATGDLSVNISYQLDQLSVLYSLIVTGIGFLIHVYSIGYMHGDRSFYRFFAYLNLFIFMMLNLVLASNFLLTFVGWEGVGVCSYLLIGFWYDRKFEGTNIEWTGDAGNKAFIVNRIGDFGFLIAVFLLFVNFGTLEYQSINEILSSGASAYYGTALMTAIGLLIFLGCSGKSAQIPLAVWLPDAMAGPTPVSALIHAATMVTAGIFLIARNSIIFSLSPTAMSVVAGVGLATAFFAATVGLVQNDFKKVLAYSTVSQLGYMFLGLGVGAFTAGVFHVMTHAFFKGLLFLAAGAVIHGMHDEQNIKKMGGLSKSMPGTYKTFAIATLAIAGIPFFSGFFSKDEILWMAFSRGNWFFWIIGAMAALFTAFYMTRLLMLVFHGKERYDHHHVHPHEAPKLMLIPLYILAFLSAFGGFLGIPYALGSWFSHKPNLLETWLEPIFKESMIILGNTGGHAVHIEEYILMTISVAIGITGILVARKWYSEGWAIPQKISSSMKGLYQLLLGKYKLDEFYYAVLINPIVNISNKILWKFADVKIIDGIVNGSASVIFSAGQYIRRMQTGIAQNYAIVMMVGILIILTWLITTL